MIAVRKQKQAADEIEDLDEGRCSCGPLTVRVGIEKSERGTARLRVIELAPD